jgi:tetrahydromethanopterin S-methyltransferase subunit G
MVEVVESIMVGRVVAVFSDVSARVGTEVFIGRGVKVFVGELVDVAGSKVGKAVAVFSGEFVGVIVTVSVV